MNLDNQATNADTSPNSFEDSISIDSFKGHYQTSTSVDKTISIVLPAFNIPFV